MGADFEATTEVTKDFGITGWNEKLLSEDGFIHCFDRQQGSKITRFESPRDDVEVIETDQDPAHGEELKGEVLHNYIVVDPKRAEFKILDHEASDKEFENLAAAHWHGVFSEEGRSIWVRTKE